MPETALRKEKSALFTLYCGRQSNTLFCGDLTGRTHVTGRLTARAGFTTQRHVMRVVLYQHQPGAQADRDIRVRK